MVFFTDFISTSQGIKPDVSFWISRGGCRGNLLQKPNRFSHVTFAQGAFNAPIVEADAHGELNAVFCRNNSVAFNSSSLHKPLVFSHEIETVTQKKMGKLLENLTVFWKGIWQLGQHYPLHCGWKKWEMITEI